MLEKTDMYLNIHTFNGLLKPLKTLKNTFSATTLLARRYKEHPACKETDWQGAGMVPSETRSK